MVAGVPSDLTAPHDLSLPWHGHLRVQNKSEVDALDHSQQSNAYKLKILQESMFVKARRIRCEGQIFTHAQTYAYDGRTTLMPSRTLGDNYFMDRIRDTPDVVLRNLEQEQHPSYSFVVGSDGIFDTFSKTITSSPFLRSAEDVNKGIINYVDSAIVDKAIISEVDGSSKLFDLARDLVQRSQESREADRCHRRKDDTTAVVGFLAWRPEKLP
eukprot:TRINITY_DN10843_c0_g2_i2.p1 TRINITY_DN10843_c0_g2~~TRINITY_DN10843_c0_g2_i2.p1  ORF type:complete len:213 (+),score=13.25 TRINITY_DN10843_c0_g2_i2:42-680(+)